MTFSNFNNGNLITFKLHNRQDKIMVIVFTQMNCTSTMYIYIIDIITRLECRETHAL